LGKEQAFNSTIKDIVKEKDNDDNNPENIRKNKVNNLRRKTILIDSLDELFNNSKKTMNRKITRDVTLFKKIINEEINDFENDKVLNFFELQNMFETSSELNKGAKENSLINDLFKKE